MQEFIQKHYINPILYYEGYNIINTLTYAIIAILMLYIIYKLFKIKKINIEKNFFYGVIGFVLFGSTFRVVVDAFEKVKYDGVFSDFILKNKIFEYQIITTSPTIYITTAILFFLSYYFERKIKFEKFSFFAGILLFLICFSFIAQLIKYFDIFFLIIAAAFTYSIFLILIGKNNENRANLLIFSHCLDGAATWISIDIVSKKYGIYYLEQHVIPNIIGTLIPGVGFFSFFILKGIIGLIAVKIIEKEEDKLLKDLLIIAITVIGLAPGLRDLLRVSCGV